MPPAIGEAARKNPGSYYSGDSGVLALSVEFADGDQRLLELGVIIEIIVNK